MKSIGRTTAIWSTSGHCDWPQWMTVSGRRLPFAGIAKAFDCVTATKGWSRPKSVIHGRWREWQLSVRKAVVRVPRSVRQL